MFNDSETFLQSSFSRRNRKGGQPLIDNLFSSSFLRASKMPSKIHRISINSFTARCSLSLRRSHVHKFHRSPQSIKQWCVATTGEAFLDRFIIYKHWACCVASDKLVASRCLDSTQRRRHEIRYYSLWFSVRFNQLCCALLLRQRASPENRNCSIPVTCRKKSAFVSITTGKRESRQGWI